MPDKAVWLSAFASMFLHGGLMHIGSNMFFLWIFGNNIEDHLGRFRYLLFYVAGGLVALATHVALQPDATIPVVGASGAIAAVMGAYLVWFPNAPVRTLILFVFPLLTHHPAKWLLGFWFAHPVLHQPELGRGVGCARGGLRLRRGHRACSCARREPSSAWPGARRTRARCSRTMGLHRRRRPGPGVPPLAASPLTPRER